MENITEFPAPDVNISTTNLQDSNSIWFRNSIHIIRWCFLPFIIVGTVTNIINIAIFSRPNMKSSSTGNFLLALAIADLGIIYLQLFRIWFGYVNLVDPKLYFSDGFCKMANFLDNSDTDFSNWLIAAITAERVVVLGFPLKARIICTVRNARITIFILFLFVFGARSYHLVITKVFYSYGVGYACWPLFPSVSYEKMVVAISSVVGYSVVFLVFVGNIIIVALLATRKSIRSTNDQKEKQLRELTQLSFTIGIFFLVFESPRTVIPIYHKLGRRTLTSRLLFNISYLFTAFDHSMNFFIYVLLGKRFREELLQILPCSRKPIEISVDQPISQISCDQC